MNIELNDGLSFVTVELVYQTQKVTFTKVLLDTGSEGTIFSIEKLLPIGLQLEPTDTIHRIRGVGGTEFVFTKHVDILAIGTLKVPHFEIEVGTMDYGLDLDGILGLDFLLQVGAKIDFARLEIA